jgi:hypothetical protein
MGTGTNFYPYPLCWRAGNCSTRPEPDPLPSLNGAWVLTVHSPAASHLGAHNGKATSAEPQTHTLSFLSPSTLHPSPSSLSLSASLPSSHHQASPTSTSSHRPQQARTVRLHRPRPRAVAAVALGLAPPSLSLLSPSPSSPVAVAPATLDLETEAPNRLPQHRLLERHIASRRGGLPLSDPQPSDPERNRLLSLRPLGRLFSLHTGWWEPTVSAPLSALRVRIGPLLETQYFLHLVICGPGCRSSHFCLSAADNC